MILQLIAAGAAPGETWSRPSTPWSAPATSLTWKRGFSTRCSGNWACQRMTVIKAPAGYRTARALCPPWQPSTALRLEMQRHLVGSSSSEILTQPARLLFPSGDGSPYPLLFLSCPFYGLSILRLVCKNRHPAKKSLDRRERERERENAAGSNYIKP